MKLVIPGVPPSLNAVMRAARMHWAVVVKMKRDYQDIVAWQAKRQKVAMVRGAVDVRIDYYFGDHRNRDYDNYSGKFILDGIKGIMVEDDGQKFVKALTHRFLYDKKEPRTEVVVEPHVAASWEKEATPGS